MKYYLRQRIFAFADTYDITDENKQPLYRVKSRLFSFGSKISLRDLNDVEQFFINQKIWHFFPHYQIEKDGQAVGMVKRKFSFFPKYELEGVFGDFAIEGNIFAWDFIITNNGRTVASLHKRFFSLTDSYEIDVLDESLAPLILTLVLVIDTNIHNNNKHSQ